MLAQSCGLFFSLSERIGLRRAAILFKLICTLEGPFECGNSAEKFEMMLTKKAELSQRCPLRAMRPIYWWPENFREFLSTPAATFSNF